MRTLVGAGIVTVEVTGPLTPAGDAVLAEHLSGALGLRAAEVVVDLSACTALGPGTAAALAGGRFRVRAGNPELATALARAGVACEAPDDSAEAPPPGPAVVIRSGAAR
ncbi:STAS domain-containing protein [Amycolatopsis sp. NPDC004368]